MKHNHVTHKVFDYVEKVGSDKPIDHEKIARLVKRLKEMSASITVTVQPERKRKEGKDE